LARSRGSNIVMTDGAAATGPPGRGARSSRAAGVAAIRWCAASLVFCIVTAALPFVAGGNGFGRAPDLFVSSIAWEDRKTAGRAGDFGRGIGLGGWWGRQSSIRRRVNRRAWVGQGPRALEKRRPTGRPADRGRTVGLAMAANQDQADCCAGGTMKVI